MFVNSFVLFENNYKQTIIDTKDYFSEAVATSVSMFEQKGSEGDTLLNELSYFLDLGDFFASRDIKKLNKNLEKLSGETQDFQIFILENGEHEQHNVLASSQKNGPSSIFISREKFKWLARHSGGFYLRNFYLENEKRFVPFLFLVKLFYPAETHDINGMLLVLLNIEKQLNALTSKNIQRHNIGILIGNSDTIIFSASDPIFINNYFVEIPEARQKELVESNQIAENSLAKTALLTIKNEEDPFFDFIFQNQVYIAQKTFVDEFGLYITAYATKSIFFDDSLRHFLFTYFIYGIILVIGGGCAYYLSLLMSRPLIQLSNLMNRVSSNDFSARFEKEPLGFEINMLGETFNNTIDAILTNMKKAEDAIVKSETYQYEITIGRQVQLSLLPRVAPIIEGAEVAGSFVGGSEIGGDFCSYFTRKNSAGDDLLFINVGDAAGKGIFSCLYALSVRSLVRAFSLLFENPAEILSHANQSFLEETADSGMFSTVISNVYNPKTNKLLYYSCGHVSPILRRENGQIVILKHSGMALGLINLTNCVSDSIQLQRGDLLIFYTSGLLEATNENNQPFSERRLCQILQQRRWESAQEALDGILFDIKTFTNNKIQEEEISLVVLKINNSAKRE